MSRKMPRRHAQDREQMLPTDKVTSTGDVKVIAADLVHFAPAFAAALLQAVFDVCKGLVHVLGESVRVRAVEWSPAA